MQRIQPSNVLVLSNNQHRSTSNDNSNYYVTVEIAGVDTDLLIDTGAQVSVLTKTAQNQFSPQISIQPTRNNLKHFGEWKHRRRRHNHRSSPIP